MLPITGLIMSGLKSIGILENNREKGEDLVARVSRVIGIDRIPGSDRPPRVSRGRLCFAPAGTPAPTRTARAAQVASTHPPTICIIPAANVGLCDYISTELFRSVILSSEQDGFPALIILADDGIESF